MEIKGGRQWFLDLVQEQARRFIQKHEDACKTVENAVENLAEAIRATEQLDD